MRILYDFAPSFPKRVDLPIGEHFPVIGSLLEKIKKYGLTTVQMMPVQIRPGAADSPAGGGRKRYVEALQDACECRVEDETSKSHWHYMYALCI
jgi:hypothetical protein